MDFLKNKFYEELDFISQPTLKIIDRLVLSLLAITVCSILLVILSILIKTIDAYWTMISAPIGLGSVGIITILLSSLVLFENYNRKLSKKNYEYIFPTRGGSFVFTPSFSMAIAGESFFLIVGLCILGSSIYMLLGFS